MFLKSEHTPRKASTFHKTETQIHLPHSQDSAQSHTEPLQSVSSSSPLDFTFIL